MGGFGGNGSIFGRAYQGYMNAEHERATQEFEANKAKATQTLAYLHELSSNPNVPQEHQTWALGEIQKLLQYTPNKPFPKDIGNISNLPPVMRQNPARQAVTQAPGMTLTAPMAPGAPSAAPGAPGPAVRMPAAPSTFNVTAPPPPPGDQVGRSSNGTVNALGAAGGPGTSPAGPLAALLPQAPGLLTPPSSSPAAAAASTTAAAPNAAPSSATFPATVNGRPASRGVIPFAASAQVQTPAPPPSVVGAPLMAPVSVPPGPQTVVRNPTAPTQISPAGQLHLLTPEDRALQNINVTQAAINRLQELYPDKDPEDLAYFAQHGEFPKATGGPGASAGYTLGPGQKRFDPAGKLIAENKDARPGAKSGYKYDRDTGSLIDLKTGGAMTAEEVAAIPRAKAVLDLAAKQSENKQAQALAKEVRQQNFRMAMAARSHEYQAQMMDARQEALTNTNKTMFEKAPKVQALVAAVRRDMENTSTGPMAGRWQEFWSGRAGTSNPEFTKLRTDVGLLQTALMQMHVGARGGKDMLQHFKGLIDSGKQSSDNMNAALEAISDYANDIQQNGLAAKAAVSSAARGRGIQTPNPPPVSAQPGQANPPGHTPPVKPKSKWEDFPLAPAPTS